MRRLALVAVIIIVLLLALSAAHARRITRSSCDLLKGKMSLYKIRLQLCYRSSQTDWTGPAWGVRYQQEYLSGHTLDYHVSIFGPIIDTNFDMPSARPNVRK